MSSKNTSAIKTQMVRVVKGCVGMVTWIASTYMAAHRAGAFKQVRQPHHTQLIRNACLQWGQVLGVDINLHKPMPTTQGLWVANHVSWVDGPVLGAHVPAFFVGKAEVAKWPLVGKLVAAGGTFFVKRGSGDAKGVSQQIAAFIAQGASVIFFPEATTTDGRRVYKLHGKLMQAAIDGGRPIQPLVIIYQNQQGQRDTVVPWVGKQTFLTHYLNVLKNDPVIAHVLPLDPVSAEGLSLEQLRDQVQQVMNQGYNQLHERVFNKAADAVDEAWNWNFDSSTSTQPLQGN